MSHDIEEATRIIKSGVVSITLFDMKFIPNNEFSFLFIQIWKVVESYIKNYFDLYY